MSLSSQERAIIKRCQESVVWFASTFIKVKHPAAGIIRYKPWPYQIKALEAYIKHRMNLFRKTRQAGISITTGIFVLWFMMFHSHKTVLIVSRREDDAKKFLSEYIKLPFGYLPDWMQGLWKPIVDNAHELQLANGSSVRSLTSSPNVLRSNASSLNIMDEAAFIPQMGQLWASGYPTLTHGGCLASDSLVASSRGLVSIGSYHNDDSNQWEDTNDVVYTDDSQATVIKSYYNGVAKTRIITTTDGHHLEASLPHRLRVLDVTGAYVWKYVSDLIVDDQLVLSAKSHQAGETVKFNLHIFNDDADATTGRCRLCARHYDSVDILKLSSVDDGWCPSCVTTMRMTNVSWLPVELSADLAELLGVIWGDGFMQPSGRIGISCDRSAVDYIKWLHERIGRFGYKAVDIVTDRDYSVRFHSRALVLLLRKNGLEKTAKAVDLVVPKSILCSRIDVKCAFLRGLFETDGCVSGKYVSLSSASLKLIRQIQIILLDLGMRSRIYEATRTSGFSDNHQYLLSLKTLHDVDIFRRLIGFIGNTKTSKLNAIVVGRRAHGDRYTCKAAIAEFYAASRGLTSEVRQGILQRLRKSALPRWFVRDLATNHRQLALTTLGRLALDDLFTDDIVSIADGECKTYDLTVEPTHCYVANGFVSHNSVIVISTVNGIGDWYWSMCTDAEAGLNQFNPIRIDWWDMTWQVSYRDAITGDTKVIAPTAGIRPCETKDELEKYGPYWSPWLEQQYLALQERGELWKFKQEILCEFLGSGNTIIAATVLHDIAKTIDNDYKVVSGIQTFVHPITNTEESIDFTPKARDEGLWIWEQPDPGTPSRYRGGRLIEAGRPPAQYVIGVDTMTGKGRDYHGVEVFNVATLNQAAEFMLRCLPREFKKLIDRLGRWYNTALLNIERNNGGDQLIDDLIQELQYPNIWRRGSVSANSSGKVTFNHYGFFTGEHSKPLLNKALIDHVRNDGSGVTIHSSRLLKQLNIYVRRRDKSGRDTGRTEAEPGPGNHDDLVMGLGLALVAWPDAMSPTGALVPQRSEDKPTMALHSPLDDSKRLAQLLPMVGGLMPSTGMTVASHDELIAQEANRFVQQLVSPLPRTVPAVVDRRRPPPARR